MSRAVGTTEQKHCPSSNNPWLSSELRWVDNRTTMTWWKPWCTEEITPPRIQKSGEGPRVIALKNQRLVPSYKVDLWVPQSHTGLLGRPVRQWSEKRLCQAPSWHQPTEKQIKIKMLCSMCFMPSPSRGRTVPHCPVAYRNSLGKVSCAFTHPEIVSQVQPLLTKETASPTGC